MKILLEKFEFFYADGRTDRHEEATQLSLLSILRKRLKAICQN